MQHHGHGVGVGQINGVCEDGGNRDVGRKGNNIVGIMVGIAGMKVYLNVRL